MKDFKDKLTGINTDQICSVNIDRRPIIFDLTWKDEVKFLGLKFRKAGVYSIWPGDFYSPNRDDLYSDPQVTIKMSSGDSFTFIFPILTEAEDFNHYIQTIIKK